MPWWGWLIVGAVAVWAILVGYVVKKMIDVFREPW